MRWTNWRKIADKDYWYTESLDWDGPACYELAIAGSRGGKQKTVYVGETKNEKRRISTYAKNGSHLSEFINAHLDNGWHLYYHAILTQTKESAVQLQNNLLATYNYEWNKKLNSYW
jgi:excinuclease UvrABC nuclease subunit